MYPWESVSEIQSIKETYAIIWSSYMGCCLFLWKVHGIKLSTPCKLSTLCTHWSRQFTELCWRVQFWELIIGFIPLRKPHVRPYVTHRSTTNFEELAEVALANLIVCLSMKSRQRSSWLPPSELYLQKGLPKTDKGNRLYGRHYGSEHHRCLRSNRSHGKKPALVCRQSLLNAAHFLPEIFKIEETP